MPGLQFTAEVRLWDPTIETPDGGLIVPTALLEFSPVEFRTNVTIELPTGPFTKNPCDHETTLCPECLDTWAVDHHVRIYRNGQLVADTEHQHWIGLAMADHERTHPHD